MRSFCSASSRLVVPSCDGVCPARTALDGAAVLARRRRSSSTKALRAAAWMQYRCGVYAACMRRVCGVCAVCSAVWDACGAHAPDAHEDDERGECEESADLRDAVWDQGLALGGKGSKGQQGVARGARRGKGRQGAARGGKGGKGRQGECEAGNREALVELSIGAVADGDEGESEDERESGGLGPGPGLRPGLRAEG
eukprot:scaffold93866_cov56-Phaeocystis_antarctica.AAC.1